MSDKTFITCAITGNITRPDQTRTCRSRPSTSPTNALRRGRGRAAVHIHVRDPATGKPSNDVGHYREVMERIRKRDTKLIINLTTGPGALRPERDDPKIYAPGTTLKPPLSGCVTWWSWKPDICSLTSTR
jgi:uncharacterized protein (DUF849 family)